jgi:crossover junction endodeoxyribonuclease RuvC
VLVLGVDPGTATTGYGVVRESGGRLAAVDYGVITTPKDLPLGERLLAIHGELRRLLAGYGPDAVAVEELFFKRNVRTALSVGHARGVVLLAAAEAGVPVREYTPPQVKQAVTGYGKADKAQMQAMMKTFLGLSAVPRPDDVADALAVAICCVHSRGLERVVTGAGRGPAGSPRGGADNR